MSKLFVATGIMPVCLLFFAFAAYAEPGKADIAITDMTVNSACNVMVGLKNVGTTPLPLSADDPGYGTSIQFYKGNSPYGGYRAMSHLQQPGSTITSTATIVRINGTETITAQFETNGSYIDTNPANNKMTKTLTCTPPVVPKPDLTITSVEFTQDCRPIVRLANIGNASLAPYEFSAVALQRVVDNLRTGIINLSTIDSSGKTKSPKGAAEWIDGKEYLPQSTIGYYLTTTNGTVLNDSNLNNNSITATLPNRCKTATASGKADIAITDMTVNSNCNVMVGLKNVGTTPLPLSADDPGYGTSIQFYKGTAPYGGYRVMSHLQQPGSTITSTATIVKINGTETITAQFETNGSYIDTNPANNKMTKTLTCTPPVVPKPDLTITSVDFTQDCRPMVRLANIGNASFAPYEFSAVALQRMVDNLRTGIINLSTIDSSGKTKSPKGAAEWIDGKEYLPQSTIGYYLTTTNGTVLKDSNLNNNSSTATLPDRCKTGGPVIRKTVQPPTQPGVIPKQPVIKPLK